MDVKEIVSEYLIKNNYDGLCNYGCGCGTGDLIPCSEFNENCETAKKRAATQEDVDYGSDCVIGEILFFPAENPKSTEMLGIKEVYEKYKHLDPIFSKEVFIGLKGEGLVVGLGTLMSQITYDLWQAIKEDLWQAIKEKEIKNG